MDRLDAAAIVVPGVEVRVVERCGSTNDLALQSRAPLLIAAEEQTAGRGRRGRRWHSALGASITFSLARRIARPARELPALSLVAGVAVARALRALGVPVRLKWPNDLEVEGAKLGGILVETRGGSHAVIGIGVNCARSGGLQAKVGRSMAFLRDFTAAARNQVIQRIAQGLVAALSGFEKQGLEALRSEWEAMHAHAGQRLRVRLADGRTLSGIATGIGADGLLQIHTARGVRAVTSGRVVSARTA